jgi:hypothetical protein
MAETRQWADHQSRLDWGLRQTQRQPKTHLTIAEFCRQLGVSVATFYSWKRRVQAEPRTPSVDELSWSRPRDTAEAPEICAVLAGLCTARE